MVKASYIYNFSKLIDWPKAYKTGNFVISVMGGDNLYTQLIKKYNDKRVGSQQIEIKKIPKSLHFSPCQVLFVGQECASMLPEISKSLANTPTLIIAETPKGLQEGAVINFLVRDHNLKFEVNMSNASTHKLFIGSTLKSLALNVEE